LLSSVSKLMVSNPTNAPVELVLYDVTTRRDSALSPQDCWITGLNDQTGTTYSFGNMPPGITPNISSQFRVFYNIARITRIVLEAGDTHVHVVSLAPNTIIESTLLADSNKYVKGLTHDILVYATGMPVNGDTSAVSTTSFGLNFVFSKQIRYTWSSDTTNSTFINNTLPDTLTNPEVMTEAAKAAVGLA